jgi:hypothetical protein
MLSFTVKHLKKIIPPSLRPVAKRLFPMIKVKHEIWQRTEPRNWPLSELIGKQGIERYEYSLFSQNGEDGILRYLYSEIGFRSRLFLEFGFGVTESNSLRLMLKEGFGGVFIDRSESSVKTFNDAAQSFGITNVKAIYTFLNLENLESTIIGSGLPRKSTC